VSLKIAKIDEIILLSCLQNLGWATRQGAFSQTHLVTLATMPFFLKD
jgi:hypothetical protein